MALSTSAPGIPRTVGWVPTADTSRTPGPDPGALFAAGRQWTPFGFVALGHTLSVNLTTGGLSILVNDASIPYQQMPLRVSRMLDVQEQYTQASFLDSHPNTDPRFHLFANWQMNMEVQVSSAWHHTFPELLISDGDGESTLFYREYSDFDINQSAAGSVEATLRSYGVPGRTLAGLGWTFASGDSLLRTRRGVFAMLTGRFEAETIVDPVDLRLWCFEPITGNGYRYSSEFAYNNLIDVDGLREVTVASLTTDAVDALGHTVSMRPVGPSPPYRSYLLSDGSARAFRLDLQTYVTYLDGNNPGGEVKSYVVTTVTDQTRNQKNVVEYQYDQTQRLASVTYPGHAGGPPRIVKYEYDSNNCLTKIVDPLGDSFGFTYAEDFQDFDDHLSPRLKLTQIADNEGNVINYAYNHPQRQVTVIFSGADGNTSSATFQYIEDADDTGQRFVTSQTVQVTRGYSGNQDITTSMEYSTDGRYVLEVVTDPLGNTYEYSYNDYNQTSSMVDPTGHTRSLTYDVQPIPSAATPNRYDLLASQEENIDINGNLFAVNSSATFIDYDSNSSNDPLDVHQSTHRVSVRTNELGNATSYEYDDPANTNPLGPTTVTDPLGKQTLRTYDLTGAMLSLTDAVGSTFRWTYNARGQVLASTDANGFTRFWVYDPGSTWPTDATDALGNGPGDPAHSVHFDWNDAGQQVSEIDAVGSVTEYVYFGNKRLKTITQYDPAPQVTAFAYDCAGAVTGITDPLGRSTIFRLDEASRVYETFRGLANNPSIRFVMDFAGRITTLTNRNGQSSVYGYDALGRMTNIQEPNWPFANPVNPGKSVSIKYDSLGHRLRITDSQLPSACTYTYDAVGNQRARADAFGQQLNYDYDERNDLVRVYDGIGIVDLRFGRDDAGHLISVTDSNKFDPSRQFPYVRTNGPLIDNLYQIQFDVSGIASQFDYDANRQLTNISHSSGRAAILTFGYSYRPDGLVGRTTGDHVGTYDYDGAKRLTSETDSGVQDGYDGAGNRLWRAAAAVPPAQQNVYDSDNRLIRAPLDAALFAYDAEGNRLSLSEGASITTYAYDAANRLMQVNVGGDTVQYLYDVDGRMLQRAFRHGGGNPQVERYQYANRSILVVNDTNGKVNLLLTRDDEGHLLRQRGPTTVHPAPSADPHSLFYLHDGFGSVSELVDWDGRDVFRVDYDAWGIATILKGKRSQPFLYRAGFQDGSTGLLNFGPRWYDPQFGRWLSQDPLIVHSISTGEDLAPKYGEVSNVYKYARNNPLAFYDPTGFVATLPKGWPEPPGWKGGYKWKNDGRDRLIDPDGEPWHWHPQDEGHKDHWDAGKGKDKRRLDKDGKDLGPDAFTEDEPKEEGSDEKKSDDGQTAKRLGGAAVGATATVGVGVIIWEVVKWVGAIGGIPESGGASLGLLLVP